MVYFEKWKIILILVICVLGVVYMAPNLLSRQTAEGLPTWLPHKQIDLGLDLQGGAHLLLEVKVSEAIKDRLLALVDETRVALRKARIGYTGLGRTAAGITVNIRKEEDLDRARRLLRQIDRGAVLADDGRRLTLTLTEKTLRARRAAAVQQSIEVVRRRIDETGLREPNIQSQGSDRILVQLPGVKDPERIKRLLGKTAKMNFRLVDQSMPGADLHNRRAPPGSEILPSDDEVDRFGRPLLYLVRKRVMVAGESLVDAQATIDQGRPVVSFRFDAVGARKFGSVTQRNVGKPFAIVLDKKVISAPVIREAILGGSGIISGRFTTEAARDLALLLRTGALPVPLTVLE